MILSVRRHTLARNYRLFIENVEISFSPVFCHEREGLVTSHVSFLGVFGSLVIEGLEDIFSHL